MRPIKFRGKRLDNGEWIYGNLIVFGNRTFINHKGYDEITSTLAALPATAVDTATVGQFTGLPDKNDAEIYEGDILGRYTDGGEIVPLSIVMYVDNGFFAQSLVSGANFSFNIERILERQVVVGNIHDNPELLKNKSK